MFVTINDLKLHYHVSGEGKSIILLHGWGAHSKTFEPVHQHLEHHFRSYSIDLPGFGQSDPPPVPWGTAEYTQLVQQFMNEFAIEQPILFGHSFGGRIAIRLASAEPIPKMVLIDSAGIRPKRSWKYYLKVYFYKSLKYVVTRLPILKNHSQDLLERFRKISGSTDYRQASAVMRATLVKVVNEDLRHVLPKITASTLLIWGENDQATPVADGQLMEQLLPDGGLVILKNAGHYSYLDRLQEFLLIIDNFLQEDMKNTTGD